MEQVSLLAAGINLAFAAISCFLAYMKIDAKTYLLFGAFSFFSACYFLFPAFHFASVWVIFAAAIYYAFFAWFIHDFSTSKSIILPYIISGMLLFALVLFAFFGHQSYWQVVAHVALLGLTMQLLLGAIRLTKNHHRNRKAFLALSIIFSVLALEEIMHLQFNFPLFGHYFQSFLPLDLFPVLFTAIIGNRLASDLLYKNQFLLQKEKLKLKEAEVKFKEQDLTDFGLELGRSRAFLAKLDLLAKNVKDDPTAQRISSEIKSYLSNSNSAALLQKNVQDVNHEFTSKLKEQYPSLTRNEIQICQLLRLQLSTKEIATIKNISQDSMKVMRYRIRKKVKLKTGDNLSSFIQGL